MHAAAPSAVRAPAPAHVAVPAHFALPERIAVPMRVAAPMRVAPFAYTHAVPLGHAAGTPSSLLPPRKATALAHRVWIVNPYHWHRWAWNYGAPWRPTQCYWGSGFWGPWAWLNRPGYSCYWNGSYWGAWGLSATTPVGYGSVPAYGPSVDGALFYPSYGVAPESPGAELLYDYGLQQTDCNEPDLVVIWGPDDSVICAFPNDLVGPGSYVIDPDTLTLQSR